MLRAAARRIPLARPARGGSRDQDRFFREAPDSPILIERRGALLPLHYYDPDPVYRVPAALEVAPEQPIYEIPTSTGVIRPMQRVGVLEFALNGEPMRLSALAEAPVRSIEALFIMFKDPTNETETYAGGRYLDLPRTASGLYDLDFNRATTRTATTTRTTTAPIRRARTG